MPWGGESSGLLLFSNPSLALGLGLDLGNYIVLVEELDKEEEIGCIQDEGPEEVFLCCMASLFLSPDVSQDTDSSSHKHLRICRLVMSMGNHLGGFTLAVFRV